VGWGQGGDCGCDVVFEGEVFVEVVVEEFLGGGDLGVEGSAGDADLRCETGGGGWVVCF